MNLLPRPRARLLGFGALLALGLLAFLPGVALADNCTTVPDCWRTAGGAAATAIGIGVAVGVAGVGTRGDPGKTGGKDAPSGTSGPGSKQRYQGPPGYHGPHPEYERNPSGTPGLPGYDPGTLRGGVPAPRLPPPRGYYDSHPVHTADPHPDVPEGGDTAQAIRG